ncbi:MAG: hypothetical protein KIT74_03520 [Fimbriimonadales bacterium]|nr:hypothetical protein [Fimbriimonadales bacterium]
MMKWSAAFLTLVAVFGCGPSEVTLLHSAPPPEPPSGWRVHVGDGFYFFAADNWMIPAEHSELNDPDAIGNISNPAVGHGMAKPIEASTVGASVFIVDTTSRATIAESRTQLVVKKETGRRTNLKIESDRLRDKVPEILSESPLDLPIGPAHEFVTLKRNVMGDQIHEIYVVLVNERDVYTFRFTSTGSSVPIEQAARPILETLRLGSPPAGAPPAEVERPTNTVIDSFDDGED